MPWTKRESTLGILAFFLIAFAPLLVKGLRRPARSSPVHQWPFQTQPHSPSEQFQREAAKWRMSAEDTVNKEREAQIESMGPTLSEHINDDQWRRELMARDQHGYLRRALVMARRASALARTRQETYRATWLLAALECEAGHHREELKQAQRLMALGPAREDAISALKHALTCNGLSSGSMDREIQPHRPLPTPSTQQVPATFLPPARPATPFEQSLRQAWKLRSRTILAEDRQREAMEEWDPSGFAGSASERLRREHLAQDRSGELRRARTAARRAAGLAQTPEEAYRAAWLLTMIECELGKHQAELREAQRLMALAPRHRRSRIALQHAEACNGLAPPAGHFSRKEQP